MSLTFYVVSVIAVVALLIHFGYPRRAKRLQGENAALDRAASVMRAKIAELPACERGALYWAEAQILALKSDVPSQGSVSEEKT